MRKKIKEGNNGVTLIILIITVLLLIIIGGIIIDFSNDGRIFDTARNVVNESEKQTKEQEQMVNEVRELYR